jgi:hypothetical protein
MRQTLGPGYPQCRIDPQVVVPIAASGDGLSVPGGSMDAQAGGEHITAGAE